MKWFDTYSSNTLAGSGNQYYFKPTDKEVHRGRIYYRIFAEGTYKYSLLFSNIIDSTFADGKVSHCNLICPAWDMVQVRAGVCSTCDAVKAAEPRNFQTVTFGGRENKHVMPGEFFVSDPVTLSAGKGESLCLEIAFCGEMIPYHEESILPVFVWENGEWIVSKHQNSFLCQKSYAADPQARPTMRVLDFFPAYSCYHNFNQSIKDADAPRPLYQWNVMREKDDSWVKAPKVHIPDLRLRGGVGKVMQQLEEQESSLTMIPIRYGKEESVFGIADDEHGGWLFEVVETPGPIMYSICWYAYDIHVDATHAVPPRGSCEDVEMKFRCRFSTINGKQANDIVTQAREYQWRDQQLYDAPIMSYENRFDRSLKDLPGEETAHLSYWQPSDENCRMDKNTGCSAPGSVCIERQTDKPMPSAWWTGNWGIPHDDRQIIGRRFRFSGMIKCENVTGRARLGVASTNGIGGELFYGQMTHFADGMVRSSSGSIGGTDEAGGLKDIRWVFSDSVTASADWTRVSLEFDVYGVTNTVFMEMSGTGKCWFDDVLLEDIGPMRWKAVQLSEKPFTEGLERYWARHNG